MLLETERLYIRSIKLSDEKSFIEMASDGSLTEIYGDCSECHKWMGDFVKEAIRFDLENNPNREYLAYAIEEKQNHTVIGSVGSTYYGEFGKIGVTYFIGTPYRGRGYAAEALRAFTDYFFTNYSVPQLIATARAANQASCKTLEHAGFALTSIKSYQDLYDKTEELYHFYEKKKA